MQGNKIIIISDDCNKGGVLPAKGQLNHSFVSDWPGVVCIICMSIGKFEGHWYRKDQIVAMDFICDNSSIESTPTGCVSGASNSPIITLNNTNCEVLQNLSSNAVKIWAQNYQSISAPRIKIGWEVGCCVCEPWSPMKPLKARMNESWLMDTVKIVFKPSRQAVLDEVCEDSPYNPKNPPKTGGGCKGNICPRGPIRGPIKRFTIGNAGVTIYPSQTETLANYGSIFPIGFQPVTDHVEANVDGFWHRILERPGWDYLQGTNLTYEPTSGTITKVFFTLEGPDDTLYYYEANGSWTTQDQVKEKTRGRIPLQYVYVEEGGQTKYKQQYTYSEGNVVTQQNPGTAYIIYSYDDATEPEDKTLTRIWAGTVPADHADPPTDPDSGRWIDLEYDSESGMLVHVEQGCDSCGDEQYYEYEPATVGQVYDPSRNPYYDPDDPYTNNAVNPNNWWPREYLISKIKDADQNVLVSYQYDSQDLFTGHWLGDPDSGLQVAEWIHTDGYLERRDYVNNTQYRAKVYLTDENQTIDAEYHYQNLQSGDTPTGPYSVITYDYETDGSNNLTCMVTTLSQGNKIYEYYGTGGVTKRERSNIDEDEDPVTEAVYTYTSYDGMYLISQAINTYGATTNYSYQEQNLTKRTDPDPDNGAFGSGRQTTEYEYDSYNVLTWERRKDSTGSNWVTTTYSYDDYDNLTTQIEAYGSVNAATTIYEYNEYNEPTKVTDAEGRISRTFYSSAGGVIGEAVYLDATNVINASKNTYDTNGRLAMSSVVNEPDVFTNTDLQLDLAEDDPEEFVLDWVHEVYEYDVYGRRTAVIADAGGTALTTRYEYNNQSEVVKVIQPDTRFAETIRGGRGQVHKEITGINGVGKATTKYFYDSHGNLLRKEDPEGVKITYKYDSIGRLVGEYRGF